VKRSDVLRGAAIAAAIITVTALHLLAPLDQIVVHEILQRAYYVPIIVAALAFGLRGGLAAALFASAAYLPHIALHWHHEAPAYAINQYLEIVLFNVVGVAVGVLGDRSRHARLRAEGSAEELRRAYAELRRTFDQLVQADRMTSLGELSASVVHEIRNPLASIQGAVEILQDEIATDSPRREFAGIALREIGRLNGIVEHFLTFARPPKPVVAPTDVDRLVRTTATLVEHRAASRGVLFEIASSSQSPLAMVDSEQLTQVLINLFLNALDAMPDGGRIRVRTELSDDERIVSIEVADQGAGIDPALLDRVFDPFVTTKERGLGLGLSIAYRIVAEHGGSITVRNGDAGAVFRLTLPAGEGAADGSAGKGG
jgi:signal transduction histidine kinase